MKATHTWIILAVGLALGTPARAADAAANAGKGTATNFEGVDLTDTKEDPAYATAGEELAHQAAGGVIGTAAPVAKMKTIDGETLDLADFYGKKPVYIKFWATWCAPCRQQTPGFEKAHKLLGEKIQFVAVNIGYSDDEASVRTFREKYGMTMPIVIDDGRLGKLFHASVTPQHVLIGKDARFSYIGHAENEALAAALQQAVQAGAGEAASSPATVAQEIVVTPGAVVPELSVTLLNGERAPLKAKPGRLLAIQFFSSWCEWYLETSRPVTAKACTQVREEIERLSAETASVDWLGIAGGPWATEQDLKDYQTNYKVSIPLALDQSNDTFRTFGIQAIPSVALINDRGELFRVVGPEDAVHKDGLQVALRETGFLKDAAKRKENGDK